MESLNSQLLRAFKKARILPRMRESPGIWLSFLLPLAVIVSSLNNPNKSEAQKLCSVYSFNIILNVLYLFFHIHRYKSLDVIRTVHFVYGVPISIIIFLYQYLVNIDFKKNFCFTISNGLLYFEGIQFFMKAFPKTFTFGEVNIAVQGLSLFIFNSFLYFNRIAQYGIPHGAFDESLVILLLVLSWILVFCYMLYISKNLRTPKFFYLWSLSICGLIYFSVFYILDCNCFLWLWHFLTKTKRIPIIIFWMVCSTMGLCAVQYYISAKKKSNTIVRKYFHALIVFVFLTGIFLDKHLLYFSSGCIFGLFIILEVFRLLNVPPLYKFLSLGFSIFHDEKDADCLALTPICLLVGHSLPLWLHPQQAYSHEMHLPLMSGVLSVGIGDTFASIGGKLFGKHKYKDSVKTIEGTFFCILSQVIFLQMLVYFGLLQHSTKELIKIIFAIFVTSFVEAKTDQIDNIVLPLVMYILLMA